MIASRKRLSPQEIGCEFAEWAALFSERIFMILTIYADESAEAGKIVVVGGYMATPDQWGHAVKRWRTVLENYKVKHFHFRQFNSRADCQKSSSPYFQWSWKKRDNFFYDLAMSMGQKLVPIGGDYFLEGHIKCGHTSDPYEMLFKTFFRDVTLVVSRHFPTMTGKEFQDKIMFICDVNPNNHWTNTFKSVHGSLMQTMPMLGGLSFENDEDPAHCGLQMADYLAAIFRQNASEKRKTGTQRKPRIIDFIVFRNLGDPRTGGATCFL